MDPKRVLAVCGTGGVTSGVIAAKVREIAEREAVPVEIVNTRVFDMASQLESGGFDLIVTATRMPADMSVPVINCMAFLTGVGEPETVERIVTALREG